MLCSRALAVCGSELPATAVCSSVSPADLRTPTWPDPPMGAEWKGDSGLSPAQGPVCAQELDRGPASHLLCDSVWLRLPGPRALLCAGGR